MKNHRWIRYTMNAVLVLTAGGLTLTQPGCPVPTPTPAGVKAGDVETVLNDTFNTVDRTLELWNIQPGLGTVMIEYGKRFFMIQKAVEAGDWGMAQYQLKEQLEIQEVGETTRPARADALKAFEHGFLDPISADIENKDSVKFLVDFAAAVVGCNACHAANEHAFVVVQPALLVPEVNLDLGASDLVAQSPAAPFPTPTPPFAADQALTGTQVNELIDFWFDNLNRNLALWNIQPGLGTVMIEYGQRFAMIKLAADADDWAMAQYQLKEALEIQEVGEITRPARAAALKAFEDTFLTQLHTTIVNQDPAGFDVAYAATLAGCNACHAAAGFPFVQVMPPTRTAEPILTLAESDVVEETASTPPAANPPTVPATPTLQDATNAILFRFNNIDRNLELWNIQPGLGTVMIEYGYRMASIWFAGEAEDWPMVNYQITEAIEIQEVGEVTRPARAQLLKDFEQTLLEPIQNAADAEDKAGFEAAFADALGGCRNCHVATGFPFIVPHTPTESPAGYVKP